MQVILLIIAVSVDVFVACVACGSEQIKIGSAAALCISTVCSNIRDITLCGDGVTGGTFKKICIILKFFRTACSGNF